MPRKGRVLLAPLQTPDTDSVSKNLLTFWNSAELAKSFLGFLDFRLVSQEFFMGTLELVNSANVASDNTVELPWEGLLPRTWAAVGVRADLLRTPCPVLSGR